MNTMNMMHRAGAIAGVSLGALLVLPPAEVRGQAGQQPQAAVITGKITTEFGAPIDQANVYINDLTISVATDAQGVYRITVPAARVSSQQLNLRVRAIGYQPGLRPIRITLGSQTQDFALRQDINRLNEIVVTGVVGEGVERAKVPFAIGRLTNEDIPIPALDPIRALQGKVAGVRVAQTGGGPGSSPEIMVRGPTSINAAGRSQGPLIIVDGVIMNVGGFDDLGGMDIESVELVKGAAGASLYGSKAANGVIQIKTKRGASQDGVKFTVRSEYGLSDVNSLNYGIPVNHPLQLDETGKRFCVQGSSNVAPCSRSFDWMKEIMRINNFAGDSTRTQQNAQWNTPGIGDGSLTNVFQSNIWPGQYYNTFAQISTTNPIMLNSLDATGRMGGVRFYVSGAYTDDNGAFRHSNGQQQRRARVNLDYDVRNNMLVSVSTLYDKGTTDTHNSSFGTLLRGAPPGTDYLARDTLDRRLLRGGGSGFRPTGNGGATFLYDSENSLRERNTTRYTGAINASYFPADWVTFEANLGYDNRQRFTEVAALKGYRTTAFNSATNFGNMSVNNQYDEAMNGSLTATLRKQITNDLSGKVVFRGLFDNAYSKSNDSDGEQFVVKDVFTLSNTATNKTADSDAQTDKNMGFFAGTSADYKGRYIVDGTIRYDGSSRFGAGNRWAPFGRISGVWRISEESFWSLSNLSDFRVRASRGTAGNTPRFNAQYETYTCNPNCSLGQAGNSKLKPETTTETEVGTDFTLFNRLGVELTYAHADTKDQILNPPTAASLGFSNQWQNAGTLSNRTWELSLNMPVIQRRDFSWSMKGTWDRTRTFISELVMPQYFTAGGTGQGTGSLFLISARSDTTSNGVPFNRYGSIWGRKFYKTCGDMPASVRGDCGPGKAYQVDDKGWIVWVGAGNSIKDGITKNLWQTKLPAAQSPWNYPLYWGHPIIDRPLKGERGEGVGTNQIIGNTLPSFRMTWANNLQYKRLSAYALWDGTFGHKINNQGEGWGLLDLSSSYFDMGDQSVETAKPLGYSWRAGGSEGAGTGGFYDLLGPNNYNVEDGSYAKLREVSLTFKIGRVRGIGGDWTAGVIGRNIWTLTNYSGYDPETGVSGNGANSQSGSGLINQVDAFDFPTLRQFTFTLSTRF